VESGKSGEWEEWRVRRVGSGKSGKRSRRGSYNIILKYIFLFLLIEFAYFMSEFKYYI